MSIKSLFLKYVELQQCANDYKMSSGAHNQSTIDAYTKANAVKREILLELEKLEQVINEIRY